VLNESKLLLKLDANSINVLLLGMPFEEKIALKSIGK
jgi:hypothetical protein